MEEPGYKANPALQRTEKEEDPETPSGRGLKGKRSAPRPVSNLHFWITLKSGIVQKSPAIVQWQADEKRHPSCRA